jgi:hypothetical protein
MRHPNTHCAPHALRVAVLVCGLLLGCGPALAASKVDPALVPLASGKDYYFEIRTGTDEEALWLRRDGTYTRVYLHDTGGVETDDRGRWTVQGSRLVLDSARRVRDIHSPGYMVEVDDACGIEMLPELRKRIAARIIWNKEHPGQFLAVRRGGPHGQCGAHAFPVDVPYASSPRSSWDPDDDTLQRLLRAIDHYLAAPANRQRFVYDAYGYRGDMFLLGVDPKPEWLDSAVEVADAIDAKKWLLLYKVPFASTQRLFESDDVCDFPPRGEQGFRQCMDLTLILPERFSKMFPDAFDAWLHAPRESHGICICPWTP